MHTKGRRLYPDTLDERRVLMALGGIPLYVPRGVSPFLVSRRLTRAARREDPDVSFVRGLVGAARPGPKTWKGQEHTPDQLAAPTGQGA